MTWLDVKANCSAKGKACFKRRATAVPNAIDRIKFDFSTVSSATFETKSSYCPVARHALPCYTAAARLGFKRHATAKPNSKPTPNFECLAAKHVMFAPNCPRECYLQSETKLEPDLRLHTWRFVLNSVTEMPHALISIGVASY